MKKKVQLPDKAKMPEAVKLGRRGGKRCRELHGVVQYQKMGKLAAITKAKRYGGSDFYTLIRFGYQPSAMTPAEREAALEKVAADRARRQKRKTR